MKENCVILLVEDDENDAFFLKRALKELGFRGELRHVTNTDDAKRYLLGDVPFSDSTKFPRPQIIVADSAISVRDSGVEFLEWARKKGLFRDVPFIILSGGLSEEIRKRAEAAGVHQILTKASSYKDLLPRLRQILEQLPPQCREWLK